MALLDQHARVVNRLGHVQLPDLRLQPPLQELFHVQLEHILQLLLVVRQETVVGQALEQRGALEQARRVLLVQRQQHARGLTDVGKVPVDAPDLLLGAQAVLAADLQLHIEPLLLIRTAGALGDAPVCATTRQQCQMGAQRRASSPPRRISS